jgi:hypothetical protein
VFTAAEELKPSPLTLAGSDSRHTAHNYTDYYYYIRFWMLSPEQPCCLQDAQDGKTETQPLYLRDHSHNSLCPEATLLPGSHTGNHYVDNIRSSQK